MKKTIRGIPLLLSAAVLALAFGCTQHTTADMGTAPPEGMKSCCASLAGMSTDEAVTTLKKELNGFSDEISSLEKMVRETGNMELAARVEQQLAGLRVDAWKARQAAVSRDIQGSQTLLNELKNRLAEVTASARAGI